MFDTFRQIMEFKRKDPIRFHLLLTLVISIVLFTYLLTDFFIEYGAINLETVRSCEMITNNVNEHSCTQYDCDIAKNAFKFVTPMHVKSLYYPSETFVDPVYSRESSDVKIISKSEETCAVGGICYSPSWRVSMVNMPNEATLYSGVVTTNQQLAFQVLNSMQLYTKYYCFLNIFNDLTTVPPNATYIPKKIFIILMIDVGLIVNSFALLKLLGLYRRMIAKTKKAENEDEERKPINNIQ